ncbi:MAG: TIM barrel protein [Gaiellaceae bacterium]
MSRRDGPLLSDCRIGIAVSPTPASFAPLLYAGRLGEAARVASALGLTCLELSVRDPQALSLPELRSVLDTSSLSVSAIATGQACLADGLCLFARDAGVRAAAIERFATQCALAAELDSAVILGGVRGRLDAGPDELPRRRAAALDAIATCVREASARGVEVLLEPINRYEADFVRTVDEGLEVLDQLGPPSPRLLLDSFHMNIEEGELAGAIRRAGDRLGYVHLADSNRQAPGRGHIDFASILEALEDIAYSGPLVAEILPLPDDQTAMREAASFLARAVARTAAGSLAIESPR